MKISLNFDLVSLSGMPFVDTNGTPLHAGKTLANSLHTSNISDGLKWNEKARELYSTGETELDKSDSEKLITFIDQSALFNGIKEQLIERIKQ